MQSFGLPRLKFEPCPTHTFLGKGYQPQTSASADNPISTLIILDITKTLSNWTVYKQFILQESTF